MKNAASRSISRFLLAGVAATAIFATLPAIGMEPSSTTKTEAKADAGKAKLKLKDGRVLVGEIIAQTADVIRFKSKVSGIDVTTDYLMSDVEEVIKADVSTPAPQKTDSKPAGDSTEPAKKDTGKKSDTVATTPAAAPSADDKQKQAAEDKEFLSDAPRVYYAELKGRFARAITQTPIRKLVEDAHKNNADYLIFYLENDWTDRQGQQISDDMIGGIEELFRFEQIAPVITDEIERTWEKKPKIIFWVRQAMGGCAFLPLCVPDIYMTSDGKMGGLGGLDQLMEGRGDETVRQKQYSLRLAHAQGWANKGRHDQRIVSAMSVVSYILSYRFVGDGVELLERLPEGPNEILLTDDGRNDTVRDRVRGLGTAVLTVNAKVGKDIGLIKGIADTKEDLLFQLGLDRKRVDIDSKNKTIIPEWTRALQRAQADAIKLWRDGFQGTRVQGTWEQRRAARSKQKNSLEQIKVVLGRYDEALGDAFRQAVGIPADPEINTMIEMIKLDQERDQK